MSTISRSYASWFKWSVFENSENNWSDSICARRHSIWKVTTKVLIISSQVSYYYFSCCIDYIAAAHIKADAIIHFGPTCFSQTMTSLPYLNIFEKHTLDIDKFKTDVIEINVSNNISVVLDTDYLYQIGKIMYINYIFVLKSILSDDFKKAFNGHDVSINGITDGNDYKNRIVIFVATDKRKLRNFAFTVNGKCININLNSLTSQNN